LDEVDAAFGAGLVAVCGMQVARASSDAICRSLLKAWYASGFD
jgi:hypothetical protein